MSTIKELYCSDDPKAGRCSPAAGARRIPSRKPPDPCFFRRPPHRPPESSARLPMTPILNIPPSPADPRLTHCPLLSLLECTVPLPSPPLRVSPRPTRPFGRATARSSPSIRPPGQPFLCSAPCRRAAPPRSQHSQHTSSGVFANVRRHHTLFRLHCHENRGNRFSPLRPLLPDWSPEGSCRGPDCSLRTHKLARRGGSARPSWSSYRQQILFPRRNDYNKGAMKSGIF